MTTIFGNIYVCTAILWHKFFSTFTLPIFSKISAIYFETNVCVLHFDFNKILAIDLETKGVPIFTLTIFSKIWAIHKFGIEIWAIYLETNVGVPGEGDEEPGHDHHPWLHHLGQEILLEELTNPKQIQRTIYSWGHDQHPWQHHLGQCHRHFVYVKKYCRKNWQMRNKFMSRNYVG